MLTEIDNAIFDMILREITTNQTITTMKHYYALSDSFAGDNPREHTHGFANTDKVIAFDSKKERDAWLKTTKLLKARPLTRCEAMRMTKTVGGMKLVAVGCADDRYFADDYIVLWESA
jgi:hypothetical protein